MTRHQTVAALPDRERATFEALSENGISETIGAIMGRTGYSETETRQHLATLAARGLVSCTGAWCHRTQPRGRRA